MHRILLAFLIFALGCQSVEQSPEPQTQLFLEPVQGVDAAQAARETSRVGLGPVIVALSHQFTSGQIRLGVLTEPAAKLSDAASWRDLPNGEERLTFPIGGSAKPKARHILIYGELRVEGGPTRYFAAVTTVDALRTQRISLHVFPTAKAAKRYLIAASSGDATVVGSAGFKLDPEGDQSQDLLVDLSYEVPKYRIEEGSGQTTQLWTAENVWFFRKTGARPSDPWNFDFADTFAWAQLTGSVGSTTTVNSVHAERLKAKQLLGTSRWRIFAVVEESSGSQLRYTIHDNANRKVTARVNRPLNNLSRRLTSTNGPSGTEP